MSTHSTNITYIRTVDHSLCLYPLGKAISHDDWVPGQQIRITLNDQGQVQNSGVYTMFKGKPEQVKGRIEQHLANRHDADGSDDCSVINLFDRDGFNYRPSRILDFESQRIIAQRERLSIKMHQRNPKVTVSFLKNTRTQQQIDDHEALHIDMDAIHSRSEQAQKRRAAMHKSQIEKNNRSNAFFSKIQNLETTLLQCLNHHNQSGSTTGQPVQSAASTTDNQPHHHPEAGQCPLERFASVSQITVPAAQQFLNAMPSPERLKAVRLIIAAHLLSRLASGAEALSECQQPEDILSYLERSVFQKSADH